LDEYLVLKRADVERKARLTEKAPAGTAAAEMMLRIHNMLEVYSAARLGHPVVGPEVEASVARAAEAAEAAAAATAAREAAREAAAKEAAAKPATTAFPGTQGTAARAIQAAASRNAAAAGGVEEAAAAAGRAARRKPSAPTKKRRHDGGEEIAGPSFVGGVILTRIHAILTRIHAILTLGFVEENTEDDAQQLSEDLFHGLLTNSV